MSEPRQIVTVLGPIAPQELGVTDAHDHLFLDTPALPDDTLDDFDRAVAELDAGRASGLQAMVELTPIGLGRRPELLFRASRATGVAIVAATGFHRDVHYPAGHWVLEAPIEMLAERVVADLREGMQDGIRAGVIKGGASHERISPAEERRLRAVAAASIETGAPIFVHTEAGTFGPEIVNLLLGEGLAADRITLAHLDRNADLQLHIAICARGINLVYDTIGRTKYAPDSKRIDLIEGVVRAGYGGQLMLGLDLGRRSYFRSFGGAPGMRHLMASFVPALRERIGDAAVDAMLVANPARVLAMPA